METIRQLVVDSLKLRLAAITIENGYRTDLGNSEIEESPIAEQFQELPGLGIFDLVNKSEQSIPLEKGIPNALPVQIRFFVKRNTSLALLRLYLADVMKAVITDPATGKRDPTLGVPGVIDTKPDEDGFIRDKETYQVDAGAVGFTVEFFSAPFNAYGYE